MQFSRLVEYFGKIEGTSLRNEKTTILSEIIKEVGPEEVAKLVYLSLGGLRPAYDRLEFNMAEKMILRALGKTEKEYQEVGDIGELAANTQSQKFRSSPQVAQRSELEVSKVYGELEKIALASGVGSQERKVAELAKLVSDMSPEGAKYIVRIVAGKLRLGFSDKTVMDALSYSENGTKDYSEMLDRAYQIRPDVGYLAEQVKKMGVVEAATGMSVKLGTPIVPALAQRLKTSKEMIEKMGRVIVEKKFDGTRVQIHFSRKMKIQDKVSDQAGLFEVEQEKPSFFVRTFTRNLDESSAMFPELAKIGTQIKADEVILDSEAVGYDPKTGKLVPFQMTITRKRKHGIEETASSVPLKFFVFDIMYKDGESLLHVPLKQRREILSSTIDNGEVLFVDDYIETDSADTLRSYHKSQLEAGFEGALVKQIDGEYMPGRTGYNWVKFKESEDSRAKLADTIDGVIMGYYLGKGKRSGFGIGAFLLGIRSGDKIVTLAKVGTGITDLMFKELIGRLEKIKTERPDPEYEVPEILAPDVYVEPRIVVEVAADEITISPSHSAGYALRFPRLVRLRDDKSKDQLTTREEVLQMFGI